ncbi:MAG: glycosyltransferase, partial [Candidatus Babeliales bacterium]
MKLYIFICTLFLFTCSANSASDPLLAVAIMVKNEAPVLAKTLEPFVQTGVTQFLIYDTGSTDGTIDIAQQFFNEHHLTDTLIIQEPFIDFAVSRNNALKVAEKRFAATPFIMMPDAEWYLNNPEQLMALCALLRQAQDDREVADAYLLCVRNQKEQVYRPCLFKTAAHVRFKGSVHEYVAVPVDV